MHRSFSGEEEAIVQNSYKVSEFFTNITNEIL